MPFDEDVLDTVRQRVRDDVTGGFDGVLTGATDPFDVELDDSILGFRDVTTSSETVVAVPWVFRCTHTGPFLGVPATFVELDLRGATFVHVEDLREPDKWTYFRYIDFIGALHQMGVATTTRPALTEDQFAVWADNQP
jgi:hypothetical protein